MRGCPHVGRHGIRIISTGRGLELYEPRTRDSKLEVRRHVRSDQQWERIERVIDSSRPGPKPKLGDR